MMIKVLIFLVAGALLLSAGDDKKPPKTSLFTAIQRAVYDKTNAQAEALSFEFKIQDYRKKLEPIALEQNAVIEEACKALGIPEDKIKTNCGVDPSLIDPATKKVIGGVFEIVPPATEKAK